LLKGRSVEIDVPPGLPLVEVDSAAIERVIANLVHNALKYASNSHIRLSANAVGDVLQLRVEDDGPGISRRDREHIFKRFYRGERGHASGQSGSGLGLSICLSIVRAHGGCIWADTRPGGGARFTVVLPFSTQQHRGPQAAAVDVRRIGRVRSETPAHMRRVLAD
jgi:two-component system sensor histidine kinase KdpD